MPPESGITDAHCHLDILTELEKKIDNARKYGINQFVTSALNPESVKKSFGLAGSFPKGTVSVTIGIDPIEAGKTPGYSGEMLGLIKENSGRICGIGEIGLDYSPLVKPEEREVQMKAFLAAISLANELKLPVTVHSRSAGKYALETLLANLNPEIPALMHAFDGRASYAIEAISKKKNLFFSIPPSVARKENVQKANLVEALPLERLLLESDSPSLAPVPGEENEPANIDLTIFTICEIRGVERETLVSQVGRNWKEFSRNGN
ncbi:MAG: TatD family hydrolase [archaeon]